MRIKGTLVVIAAAAVFGTIGSAGAQPPAPVKSKGGQCFFSSEWRGWRATPDNRAMYLHVGVNQVWRADFADECPELNDPNAHLVTTFYGGGSVCDALDLNVKVSTGMGFAVPCIVSKLTKLSDAEVQAIPAKDRP